jgi:signal peptidase I
VAVPGEAVPPETWRVLGAGPGRRVPPGRFIAYGDNLAASADSRQLGYFHGENLLGVVVARLQHL